MPNETTKDRVFIICGIGCFVINLLFNYGRFIESSASLPYVIGLILGMTICTFGLGYVVSNYIFKSKFIETED